MFWLLAGEWCKHSKHHFEKKQPSEPHQSNPENEISKHDQLQSATPSSLFFVKKKKWF
jgi:hypothetical protein